MEFPGVGTVSMETPTEDLKPFFRRKNKTVFRNYNGSGGKMITKEQIETLSKFLVSKYPEEKRKAAYGRIFGVIEEIILLGKESITEEEFVEEWLKMIFCNTEKRKEHAERMKELIGINFETVDTDQNGIIDYEEFRTWYEMRSVNQETTKLVFDTIDDNKDGVISFDEWTYGAISFTFTSGPDHPFSLWWGPLVEE